MEAGMNTKFYARLLGGFSLTYGGEEMRLDTNIRSKYMQIFLMLIKAGSRGKEREELLKLVYKENQEHDRQGSNLRQQIYLLRRIIERSNLPPGNYVVKEKSRYYFSRDYQVETDTGHLDQLLTLIRSGPERGEKTGTYQKLLTEFCHCYTGEFLPMLNGEEWVTVESAYYQKWYFSCLNQLCGILKEQGQYEEMLELCTAASQMHPYDDWQAVQIDCLMQMHRYKEAQKVYEKASEQFYEELGTSTMDQVMARYRNTGRQTVGSANTIAFFKEALKEPGAQRGAYRCSFPSFLDIYRIICRQGERVPTKCLLMSVTMEEGGRNMSEEQLTQKMELIRKTLSSGVRSGDIYTRYSRNQYLFLLVNARQQNGSAIVRRLQKQWKLKGDGQTNIQFAVQEAQVPGVKGDVT